MPELYDHQKEAIKQGCPILSDHKLLYLGMEVRTGKTLTVMSIIDKMRYGSCLFITKKKAIQSIKDDYSELQRFTGNPPCFTLEVINYESVHKINDRYPEVVVIDEAHSLGAFPKPGKRTSKIKDIIGPRPVIFLSGTPSPESYSQLFHQFWVSDNSPWSEYRNFYKWAAVYVKKYQRLINGHPINFYDKARKELIEQDVAHLIVSVSQDDAGFTCKVDEKILFVPMAPHIKMMYQKMLKDRIVKHNGEVATAANGADLINKLCQISSGSLIFDEQENGRVIDVSKAHFVKDRFAGQKIAILYRYRAEREVLQAFFPNWTDSPEEFNENRNKTFLAQVQSAREGVNLSTADAMVMYNIDFSATSYFQARARMQSKKREKSCPLYWIFSEGGIEADVYKAVQKKKSFTWSYYKKDKGSHRKTTTNRSIFEMIEKAGVI